jgi:hypothetical protein
MTRPDGPRTKAEARRETYRALAFKKIPTLEAWLARMRAEKPHLVTPSALASAAPPDPQPFLIAPNPAEGRAPRREPEPRR